MHPNLIFTVQITQGLFPETRDLNKSNTCRGHQMHLIWHILGIKRAVRLKKPCHLPLIKQHFLRFFTLNIAHIKSVLIPCQATAGPDTHENTTHQYPPSYSPQISSA